MEKLQLSDAQWVIDNTKGVKDVYLELKQKGYDVEIFDLKALSGQWEEKMSDAMKQFEVRTND